MLNLIDRDILQTRRPSDYDYDVYVGGRWVASAKQWHSADEVADDVQQRRLLACPTCGDEGDCPDCGWTPDAAWDLNCEIALDKLRSDPAFDVTTADDPADRQRLYLGPNAPRIVLSS